jgi:hypothetical protein
MLGLESSTTTASWTDRTRRRWRRPRPGQTSARAVSTTPCEPSGWPSERWHSWWNEPKPGCLQEAAGRAGCRSESGSRVPRRNRPGPSLCVPNCMDDRPARSQSRPQSNRRNQSRSAQHGGHRDRAGDRGLRPELLPGRRWMPPRMLSRYKVPSALVKVAGWNTPRPVRGETALRTWGSARQARASATMAHTESRCR